jgi:hypothetical protein
MALQALQNQRRPEQHVEVSFDDREQAAPQPDRTGPAGTPRTPDEVAPPAEDRPEDRAAAAEVTVPGQRAEPELPAGRDRAQ